MTILKNNKLTKKYMTPLIHYLGMKTMEEAASKPTWKTVWSAGQSVGLIEDVLTVKEIYEKLLTEYDESVQHLSKLGLQ
jgi:nitronate monooxygenase